MGQKRATRMEALRHKPLPVIPEDIRAALEQSRITLTGFEEKNEILASADLQHEVGYRKAEDGSYLVSMTCPMPGITPEMIEWWFWWHPQQDERYRVWYPGAHRSIRYDKRQAGYFECETRPPFRENSQYPVEQIGGDHAAAD